MSANASSRSINFPSLEMDIFIFVGGPERLVSFDVIFHTIIVGYGASWPKALG